MTAPDYSADYMAGVAAGSLRSAERILPIVFELLEPRSLVDVGCGLGAWAHTAIRLGVEDVIGVDGDWVEPSMLLIPPACFETRDVSRPLRLERTFDLAISLEVAEHLAPEVGPAFVAELVALAPAVLFSAAIPFQGGEGHRNERWQSYWAGLFRDAGYAPFDVVRPAMWGDDGVEPWFAQNAILYLSRERAANVALAPTTVGPLFDLVNPRLYVAQNARPELEHVLRALPAALARYLRPRVLGYLYRGRERARRTARAVKGAP